jgi:hypothetical protein
LGKLIQGTVDVNTSINDFALMILLLTLSMSKHKAQGKRATFNQPIGKARFPHVNHPKRIAKDSSAIN